MKFSATIASNVEREAVKIELPEPQDLMLTVGANKTKLGLEQVQTLILALQAAEAQMRSWKPGSPRWP